MRADTKAKGTYRRKKTVKAPRKRTFIANMEKIPHKQSESLNSTGSRGAGDQAGGGALKRLSSSGSGFPHASETPAGGEAYSSSIVPRKASPSPPVNPSAVPVTLPMVQPSFKTGAGFAFSRTHRINPMSMQPLFSADQWGVVTTEVKAPSIGIKRQAVSTQMNQAPNPRSFVSQPTGFPSYASAPTPLTSYKPAAATAMATSEKLVPAASMPHYLVPSLIDVYVGAKPAVLAPSGNSGSITDMVNTSSFTVEKDEDELSDLFAAWCEQEPNVESKRRRVAAPPAVNAESNLMHELLAPSVMDASGWDHTSIFEENHALFSSFEDASVQLDRLESSHGENITMI